MRLLICLLLFPALSFAQVPHTFNNGEVADANTVNANFQNLDGRIKAIEDAGGGGDGCTVEQVDNSAEITCADGSTAVVPGYGTVVIIPEGEVGEVEPTSIPTGAIVVADGDGVILGSLLPGNGFGALNRVQDSDGRDFYLFQNDELQDVVAFGFRAYVYYPTSDCSGQGFTSSKFSIFGTNEEQWVATGEAQTFIARSTEVLPGFNRLDNQIDPIVYYTAQPCTAVEQPTYNHYPIVPYTFAPEVVNATYPLQLQQLP